jgi:SMI1/KNR4 family protein SUKH-1
LRSLLPDETRIFGGARIGPVSELPDFSRAAREWAEETWVAEFPADRLIWDSALPLTRLENGDYLAVDLRTNATDPPVLYLNHDDESFLLAKNFAAFLGAWEGLGYIGPEHWLLREFVGPDGYLDAESERASQLRALFAG